MSKLYRARSLLYRRQILQENIRWKALDEIYKIYMLLHRSDLNISENFRQTFFAFLGKNCKNSLFLTCFIIFCSDFDEISSEFRRYLNHILENIEILFDPLMRTTANATYHQLGA